MITSLKSIIWYMKVVNVKIHPNYIFEKTELEVLVGDKFPGNFEENSPSPRTYTS